MNNLITLFKKTLLDGATSAAPGSSISSERAKGWTFVIAASDVTNGAVVDIEAEIAGIWFVIHRETVEANGSFMIRDDHGHYEKIRGNISTYQDGTYRVHARGTTHSL